MIAFPPAQHSQIVTRLQATVFVSHVTVCDYYLSLWGVRKVGRVNKHKVARSHKGDVHLF